MDMPGLFKISDTLNLPSLIRKMIDEQYERRTDKAPNLTIGERLRAQPADVQREEGIKLMQKMGILKC
jgi:hypothetical protein